MLIKGLDFKAPFIVRWLVILIALAFTTFTFYEWIAIGSKPDEQILSQHYDLSTPISNGESGAIEANVDPGNIVRASQIRLPTGSTS
jgi:hypothetical protein